LFTAGLSVLAAEQPNVLFIGISLPAR